MAALWGALTFGLLGVTAYGFVSAAVHLGLAGHPRDMRIVGCQGVPPVRAHGRGGTAAQLTCSGTLAGTTGTVKVRFSAWPGQVTKVAEEPWGTWLPVDNDFWTRLGRVCASLVPLAAAAVCGRAAVPAVAGYRAGHRGSRNSRRLPTGSSE